MTRSGRDQVGPRRANSPPENSPDLWAWIAPLGVAVSLGLLAMALASLRAINPNLELHFGFPSVLAGGLAGGAGWWVSRGFWRLGRGTATGDQREHSRLRRRVVGGLVLLGGVTMLGFATAAVGLPDSRRRDMILGAVLALLVLGTVGGLIWRLAKLFGRPDDPEGDPGC